MKKWPPSLKVRKKGLEFRNRGWETGGGKTRDVRTGRGPKVNYIVTRGGGAGFSGGGGGRTGGMRGGWCGGGKKRCERTIIKKGETNTKLEPEGRCESIGLDRGHSI